MKIKVSNYIAQKLTESGIRQVFSVTGGGAMHLNDALGHQPECPDSALEEIPPEREKIKVNLLSRAVGAWFSVIQEDSGILIIPGLRADDRGQRPQYRSGGRHQAYKKIIGILFP